MKSFHEEWEEIHRENDWGRYPSETVIRFVARNYYKGRRDEIKILDFGCGAGANTWYLAREGFDVWAFDGSPSAVKKAEDYLAGEGYQNVHFDVLDGAALTYEDDFFDCVIDNVCIYANTKECINEMYRECHRVLKTGGRIFTSVFGIETDGYETGERIEPGTYREITTGVLSGRAVAHFFEKEEFKNTLQTAGFQKIEIDEMYYTDNGVRVSMFIAKAEK